MTALRIRTGGTESPAVLLLHGLGATADVWTGLPDELGAQAWIAPDLPGHGGSAHLAEYSFAAVAEAVAGLIDPRGTVILGHSFGGVVALHLAGKPGVRAVIGLGIKVSWSDEELAKAAAVAQRPAQVFATREEAERRHLRVAGLAGEAPEDAVEEVEGGWRTTFDPRAFAVGAPPMTSLLAAAEVPVILARGERDHMVSAEQIKALGVEPSDLPGLGHNAHVEDPAVVRTLLSKV
ncbi:alpha/beta fold hydrolase [Paractinoplanes atraurantiacus]|uniref:Pimeloyl-ACP methyl ester carboxylesterase n=1 Tax=Paractinoplanes atraurantiacus TaxID=1036182 RepID=A0A285KFQ0_9ACTN|nr:alpha/beta fold hydrolase [Actinoplanes atraurantiacus]SNY71444.1 Pimeloyl-ACP methyl ester carboxylesterase [Actinoplanes atraurantiacus]